MTACNRGKENTPVMSATRKLRFRVQSKIANALGRGNKSGHGPKPTGFILTIHASLINMARKAGITIQAAILRDCVYQLILSPAFQFEMGLCVSISGDVDRAFDDEIHVVEAQIDPLVFLQFVQTIVNLITHSVLDVGF